MSERYFIIGIDESYEPLPLMIDVRISYSFINQIKNIINKIKGSDIGIEYTDTADNKTKV